jgi:uncharacterized membrane protein
MKDFLRNSRYWFMIIGTFLGLGSSYIDFFEPFYPYTYYVGIFVLLLAAIGYLLGTKTNSKS